MLDLLLSLLVEGGKQIAKEDRQRQVRRKLHELGVRPGALQIPPELSALEVEEEVRAMAEDVRRQLAEIVKSGQAVLDACETTERDLDSVPGGRTFVRIHRERVRGLLQDGVPELARRVADSSGSLPGHLLALPDDPDFGKVLGGVASGARYGAILGGVAHTRRDPEAGLRLADADAIAHSLLEPLQQFAWAQGVRFPAQRPVAVPANPGWESVWFDLLPEGHPVVFVPEDFERDLYRYASVPHELGHVVWREVVGLEDEVRAALGLPATLEMLRMEGPQVVGSVDLLYSAWLPEIWADALAVLAIGPAALRGLAFSFASPEEPHAVTVIEPGPMGYDEHPPAHVRIHLGAHLLAAMGFAAQAEQIRGAWDALHGAPDKLLVPVLPSHRLWVGAEGVLERGRAALDRLYGAQLTSLSGFRLADVPSLEMGPGLWSRVQRRVDDLVADKPFHDDGRVVLAAAIEARTRRPSLAGQITRGLRRAILGREADERRVADPSYHRARPSRPGTRLRDEVREALRFREVLKPLSARSGRRWPGSTDPVR